MIQFLIDRWLWHKRKKLGRLLCAVCDDPMILGWSDIRWKIPESAVERICLPCALIVRSDVAQILERKTPVEAIANEWSSLQREE